MSASRKDYEAIAKVLSNAREMRDLGRLETLLYVTAGVADYFASTNPAFDRHRFMVACMPKDGEQQR